MMSAAARAAVASRRRSTIIISLRVLTRSPAQLTPPLSPSKTPAHCRPHGSSRVMFLHSAIFLRQRGGRYATQSPRFVCFCFIMSPRLPPAMIRAPTSVDRSSLRGNILRCARRAAVCSMMRRRRDMSPYVVASLLKMPTPVHRSMLLLIDSCRLHAFHAYFFFSHY